MASCRLWQVVVVPDVHEYLNLPSICFSVFFWVLTKIYGKVHFWNRFLFHITILNNLIILRSALSHFQILIYMSEKQGYSRNESTLFGFEKLIFNATKLWLKISVFNTIDLGRKSHYATSCQLRGCFKKIQSNTFQWSTFLTLHYLISLLDEFDTDDTNNSGNLRERRCW